MKPTPTSRKAARAAFFTLTIAPLLLATVAGSNRVHAQIATPDTHVVAPSNGTGHSTSSGLLPVAALGALLGLDESSLLQAVPDLRKTTRPIPGPRGSRGLWALPERMVAGGIALETLFFFKAHKLERIEQRKQAGPGQCRHQFDQLTAALEAQLGSAVRSTELAPNDNRSAAWSLEAYRLAAFQSVTTGTCNLLLVHEPLNIKDATEL